MHDEDFERLCYRLIRLEYREVEKPAASGDGGADALLPNGKGGYLRAWQAKHFPKRMRWDEAQKSLGDAQRNYAPDQYTFCFPRNLTKTEQQTFDKHFRNDELTIRVDYWSGDEIQARLTETSEGRTVAKHFFNDDGETLEAIRRAQQAGGTLETHQDALARMKPIGEYLSASDPYFSYSGSTYRKGVDTHPPDGTIMSISESLNGITTRIDVVPNDEEAIALHAPKGTIRLPVEVAQDAERALSRGEEFTAKGIEVSWDQLPPGLSEELRDTRHAEVTIKPIAPPPPASWDARVTVRNSSKHEQVDIDLQPVSPPNGWDGAVEGQWAGLTMRILNRRLGDTGEAQFKYAYALADAPAESQLKALRFMDLAASPGGTMRVVDKRDKARMADLETGIVESGDDGLDALRVFLEWVVEIEQWTGQKLPIRPGAFTRENFEAAGEIAGAVRRGGFNVTVGGIEFEGVPGDLEPFDSGGQILIRRELWVTLFGEEVLLGPSQIAIDNYELDEIGGAPDGSRNLRVRPTGESTNTFEEVGRPGMRKAPPSRPKKKRKSRGRSRRRGGR